MEKFKLAVVGLHYGQTLIDTEILKESYGAPFFDVYAVCDQNEALTQEMATKYGAKAYTSIEEVLADDAIDLTVLITGPNGRAKLLDRFIDLGKPVMTTKPFETDAAEALRILKKADEKGVPLFINSPGPVAPEDVAVIREWQQRYSLGRLVGYHATNWASNREVPDGSWYDDPALCPAAPLLRIGIYCLNDLSWFWPSEVESVHVAQSRVFTKRPTADNATMTITHPDGTIGSVYASFCVADGQPYAQAMELRFENGLVRREIKWQREMTDDRVSLEVKAIQNGQSVSERRTVPKYGNGYRWDLMHAALRGEALPAEKTPPEQVAQSIRIVELMRKAALENS